MPVFADALSRVTDRAAFLLAVEGRSLTSTAVRLNILPDGQISGRAFGTSVTGTWVWTDGYFCRTLQTAAKTFALNCQRVDTDGNTIRFTADKGAGDVANLRIK